MHKSLIVMALLATTLAGCMQDPATRGLAGATAGAVLADATENDVLTGALLGGALGVASCGVELGLPPCNSGY